MKRNWMRVSGSLLVGCLLAGLLPVTAAAVTFQDVPSGHWAKGAIDRCVEQGFFQGQSATKFGLGQTMTRSSMVVVLDRFFGWEDAEFSLPFEDVPADARYAGALRSAYAKGAITGQSKQFRPGDPITREELAVMLIRALGYTGLAGVAQELPQTFADVTSNPGYITMAKDLGLLSGTKEDTFSPDKYATREQVAVILMRLHDKLQAEKPAVMGIVTSAVEVEGLDQVALAVGMLTADGTVKEMLGEETAAEILAAAERSGAKKMAYISGTASFLNRNAETAVQSLQKLMQERGYQGIVLRIDSPQNKQRKNLTSFVTALDTALGERTLQLVVPTPDGKGQLSAYDYAALSRLADTLLLQIPQDVRKVNNLVIAPMEPLEEIYRGAAQLRNSGVAAEKISLMLTTTGAKYGSARNAEPLTWANIEELLTAEKPEWKKHYSARYGCAYLEHEEEDEIIWYLDEQGAADRMRLFKLLGIGGVCLEQPAAASTGVLSVFQ